MLSEWHYRIHQFGIVRVEQKLQESTSDIYSGKKKRCFAIQFRDCLPGGQKGHPALSVQLHSSMPLVSLPPWPSFILESSDFVTLWIVYSPFFQQNLHWFCFKQVIFADDYSNFLYAFYVTLLLPHFCWSRVTPIPYICAGGVGNMNQESNSPAQKS